MKRLVSRLMASAAVATFALWACRPAVSADSGDVIVYGGTSGGVIAAVQVARMGHSVILIEPGRHLGGLTSGGLGATDVGNPDAIGGISREFYQRIRQYYRNPAAWKWERREDYRSHRHDLTADVQWHFEPHVAETIFNDLVRESGVTVVFEERLDLARGVRKEGTRIAAIVMESGREFTGKVFIDATYEGDLLAKAGVSYHVGREANSVYGETLNGVRSPLPSKSFCRPVHPYVIPGDPTSGLLFGVQAEPLEPVGSGDHRVQAYNFRLCLTEVPENRVPFSKPDGYDPSHYELLLRYLQTEGTDIVFPDQPHLPDIEHPGLGRRPYLVIMPNRKTDMNTKGAISSDFVGANYRYPDADYPERARIIAEHRRWHQGMLWFLQNDPRVPAKYREPMQSWGLAKDEFVDNDHWPHQLYVREARRMIGEYVMTEHDCAGRRTAPQSVGLGSYGMDSHVCRRYIDANGYVQNEGSIGGRVPYPYPIGYRSLTPKRDECTNLLVPVCLSATHVCYGSIRMEPVYMILGQSAGTAAVLAAEAGVDVQDVPYQQLRRRLIQDGQRLDWPPPHEGSPRRTVEAQTDGFRPLSRVLLIGDSVSMANGSETPTFHYEQRFNICPHGRVYDTCCYGCFPVGWRDLVEHRPNRAWAVDGRGLLRHMLKGTVGLLAFEGHWADGRKAAALSDATYRATFSKTEDDSVSFGVAARIQDGNNYYLARFRGSDRLELLKVKDAVATPLDLPRPLGDVSLRPTGCVTLEPYRYGQFWSLSLTAAGDLLTAVVRNDEGREMARVVARDDEFQGGLAGLCCTRFAAAASFRVDAEGPAATAGRSAPLRRTSPALTPRDYPVIRPHWGTEYLNTPREELRGEYDIIIAGAGTGGWAAAIQAARMGAKVLLLEETDWIGGQMCAAGVTTMDESSVGMKFPVRERGIYREFHESIVTYYQTLDKDPFVAYYAYPDQLEGGYEPKAARAVLYGFIRREREAGKVLHLSLRSKVVGVDREGQTVTGATIEFADDSGRQQRQIRCRILIDATEYGDVLPLAGVRYRSGNRTSDNLDPSALVQDHTWTAVVREYPDGVPEHLKIQQPPPGYEKHAAKRYRKFQNHGIILWGAPGKGVPGPRHWRTYFAWRGMADADSPLVGERSVLRHTQCGFNGGNDYPVTAATLENPQQRLRDEREGIYRTLGTLYYFQHELGVPWSLATDEGYDTPYNREKMRRLGLRPDLEAIAVHLPQQPYVRESRRMIGVETLVAADLTRFDEAKHVTHSVAMGDYFMDLDHGDTAHAIEPDLDFGPPPRGGGPFQVPFEVFLPEQLDGFLAAEKNFSQSRLASGATRLQPITMLTGQAVGAIAALAIQENVPPRKLAPKQVQSVLLDAGSTLIQRWYADVPWGTPVWKATQLLSLYQVMDRPGPITQDLRPLGEGYEWGIHAPLTVDEMRSALDKLRQLQGGQSHFPNVAIDNPVSVAELSQLLAAIGPEWEASLAEVAIQNPEQITAGEFALVAAAILLLPSEHQAPGGRTTADVNSRSNEQQIQER